MKKVAKTQKEKHPHWKGPITYSYYLPVSSGKVLEKRRKLERPLMGLCLLTHFVRELLALSHCI